MDGKLNKLYKQTIKWIMYCFHLQLHEVFMSVDGERMERGTLRVKCIAQEHNTVSLAGGPFLEGPRKFSSFSEYVNKQLCNRKFEILQWLYGPKKFPGLSRNGPQGSNPDRSR